MYHTSNNYRAARLCSGENFREAFGLPKHFSWGAQALKIILAGVRGPPSWSLKLINQ